MVTLKQRIEELVRLDLEDRVEIVDALMATIPHDDETDGFVIDSELFAELERRRIAFEEDPSIGMTKEEMWARVRKLSP